MNISIKPIKTSKEKLEAYGWETCYIDKTWMEFRKTFSKTRVVIYLCKDEDNAIYIEDAHPYKTTIYDLIAIGEELKQLEEK